jgi:hypothetical protein
MQATRSSIRPTMHVGQRLSCIVLTLAFFVPAFCCAQSMHSSHGAATEPATSPDTPASADANASIIAELEAMRKRIEQLEAQLKTRDASADSTASQLAAERESLVATDAAPALHASSSVASKAAATEQGKSAGSPAKAEPFAFADFTWLNGNPRTETPAFDSKFFTPEIRADVNYTYDFRHPKSFARTKFSSRNSASAATSIMTTSMRAS